MFYLLLWLYFGKLSDIRLEWNRPRAWKQCESLHLSLKSQNLKFHARFQNKACTELKGAYNFSLHPIYSHVIYFKPRERRKEVVCTAILMGSHVGTWVRSFEM